MAKIKLHGNPLSSEINLPPIGNQVPDFHLVKSDLSEATLSDYQGQKIIISIFPSVDTGTCAASIKKFNQEIETLDNIKILCISKDLPFAQARFCGAEGTDKVEMLSAFRSSFGDDYGLTLTDSPLEGLLARAILVVDENGTIIHSQLVEELTDEPDYQAALNAAKN